MRPVDGAQRMARWWAALYTRAVPDDLAQRRRAEIASDVWEHATGAADAGHGDARIARGIVRRVLLGAPADLRWRARQVAGADDIAGEPGGWGSDGWLRRSWWVVLAVTLALLQVLVVSTLLVGSMLDPTRPTADPGWEVWVLLLVATSATVLAGAWIRGSCRADGDALIAVATMPALAAVGGPVLLVVEAWRGVPIDPMLVVATAVTLGLAAVHLVVLWAALRDRQSAGSAGDHPRRRPAVGIVTIASSIAMVTVAGGWLASLGLTAALAAPAALTVLASIAAGHVGAPGVTGRVGVTLLCAGTWSVAVVEGVRRALISTSAEWPWAAFSTANRLLPLLDAVPAAVALVGLVCVWIAFARHRRHGVGRAVGHPASESGTPTTTAAGDEGPTPWARPSG